MKRTLLSLALTASLPVALFAQESAADVAAAVAGKTSETTLLGLLQSGGWAMIPLSIMSILMFALVLVFLLTLRRGAVVTSHFMNTAEVLLKKRDDTALLAITNRHSEVVAKILQRTLDFATHNPGASYEMIREIAQTEGATRAAALQNRTTYLADIAVLSPMVGLLGTVFGIIKSFGVLTQEVSEASQTALLAGGVSEALIATGGGLVVGIVAMAFYGIFRNRVQGLISEMERATTHLLGLLAIRMSEPRRDSGGRTTRPSRQESPRGGDDSQPPRRAAVSIDDDF